MGVATCTKIPQEVNSGGKRQTWGYVTVNTQATAITIHTGLNYVDSIELQPYISSGVSATEATISTTLPSTTGDITFFGNTGVTTYYWLATGI